MRLEASMVDRHDLEAIARSESGWITVVIKNVVDVPVEIPPGEWIIAIIVPEKREPMSDSEKRARILQAANRGLRLPYKGD